MSSGASEDATQPLPPQQQQTIPPLQQIPQAQQQHSVPPPPPPPYPPLPSEVKPPNVVEGGSEGVRETDSNTGSAAGTSTGGTGPPQPLLLEHIPHPLQPLHPQIPGETQNEMDISDGENEGGSRESSELKFSVYYFYINFHE